MKEDLLCVKIKRRHGRQRNLHLRPAVLGEVEEIFRFEIKRGTIGEEIDVRG